MHCYRNTGKRIWGTYILSLLLHVGVGAFFVWHARHTSVSPPQEQTVEVVYEAGQEDHVAAKSSAKQIEALPPAPTLQKAPSAQEKPQRVMPFAPPPPSPPPPPKAESAPEISKSSVKSVVESHASLHDKSDVGEKQKEPRQVPSHHVAQMQDNEKKVEKPPVKVLPSRTEQPRQAPKEEADSHSLLATLDKFRAQQKQDHVAKVNPAQGGSPHGGGRNDGDMHALTSSEQGAIGSSVQRCYQEDTLARNYKSFEARMVVTVDATGEARLVDFSSETRTKMALDALYRVQAERARDAVLSPVCSHLPIPKNLLGQVRQFHFLFRP